MTRPTDQNEAVTAPENTHVPNVVSWESIEETFAGNGGPANGGALLLGNGFSSNIWPAFAYKSLLEESRLTGSARDLFRGRFNFETVLAELSTARQVIGVTAPEHVDLLADLDELQRQVRGALVATVGNVHPDANRLLAPKTVGSGGIHGVPVHVVSAVAAYMPRYSRVFVTNYDLISYWASVQGGAADLFPGSDPFDVEQAETWLANNPDPKIFFLHGALHLRRSLSTNVESKHTAGQATRLLDVIRTSVENPDLVPLFISEGTSTEKVARIRSSQYLSFCARTLDTTTTPLTVLGQGLEDVDAHVTASIQNHRNRKVAIGVHIGDIDATEERADALQTRANQIHGRLPPMPRHRLLRLRRASPDQRTPALQLEAAASQTKHRQTTATPELAPSS